MIDETIHRDEMIPGKLFLERDPLHPNAAGNEIIARRLFEEIKPGLVEARTSH